MYYITNQNDQVIAASADLLALLQVDSIDALYRQIALDAIEFDADAEGLTLKTPLDETRYNVEKETLSSLLGSMTLVHLTEETAKESTPEEEILPPVIEEAEEKEEEFSLLEDNEEPLIKIEDEVTEKEDTSLLEENEEPLFEIREEAAEEEEVATPPEPEAEKEEKEEDDLFDLILPSSAEETIGQIGDEALAEKAKAPVYIDVEHIAEKIGISAEDYNTFLTE